MVLGFNLEYMVPTSIAPHVLFKMQPHEPQKKNIEHISQKIIEQDP